jgi:hypothetical protein
MDMQEQYLDVRLQIQRMRRDVARLGDECLESGFVRGDFELRLLRIDAGLERELVRLSEIARGRAG